MGLLTKIRDTLFGRPAAPVAVEQHAHERERRDIRASYDVARADGDYDSYWRHADSLDADSANSKFVRQRIVPRARHEAQNSGYQAGMQSTHANFLVGVGPSLRMQTGNSGFNQAVETTFAAWAKAILWRRKLWTLAHAKVQDGEGFGVVGFNSKIKHKIQLDVTLVETEVCTTPTMPYGADGEIDGVSFDEFGNAEVYHFAKKHPGAKNGPISAYGETIDRPAEEVLHWFALLRPGQHRGVPEFTSTLNTGVSSRRFREATVAAAETAADLNVIMSTQSNPNVEPDEHTAFDQIPISKRMMTSVPMGWGAEQMRAEHPNATYESFIRSQISEVGRAKNMPYNLAACDSSRHNFASGKLDALVYFAALDVERHDCNDLVLDPLFAVWWSIAVVVYGWNADPDAPPAHSWTWPRHPIADAKSHAEAIDKNLRNGTTSLSRVYADAGLDFEDEVQQLATDYGVDVVTMKATLFKAIFAAAAVTPTAPEPGIDPETGDDPNDPKPPGAEPPTNLPPDETDQQ